jgi:hypothetical protein
MTQELTPYDVVIADLESKRDQISATIEMLKALRGTASIPLPLATLPQRNGTEAEFARDAFFGMSLPEAAKKYLAVGKVTKSNPAVCEALLRGGFKTQSNNFAEVVRSTLGRNPDFVRVSGEWGLAEWYGNRGGGRRTKRPPLATDYVEESRGGEPENQMPPGDDPGGI